LESCIHVLSFNVTHRTSFFYPVNSLNRFYDCFPVFFLGLCPWCYLRGSFVFRDCRNGPSPFPRLSPFFSGLLSFPPVLAFFSESSRNPHATTSFLALVTSTLYASVPFPAGVPPPLLFATGFLILRYEIMPPTLPSSHLPSVL